MKRVCAALLLAVVPILSVGQSDARVVRPEIRVGDSWTYRSTNIGAPGTHEHEMRVSFVDDKVILVVSTRKSDGKELDSSWTSEWNAVISLTGIMYQPHTGVFRFPLRLGDKHEMNFDTKRPRVHTMLTTTKITVSVVGWETIEVSAGKFRAMKLAIEGTVLRLDNSQAYPMKGAYWYVPEVRRWVKYQVELPWEKRGEELLAYKLNED